MVRASVCFSAILSYHVIMIYSWVTCVSCLWCLAKQFPKMADLLTVSYYAVFGWILLHSSFNSGKFSVLLVGMLSLLQVATSKSVPECTLTSTNFSAGWLMITFLGSPLRSHWRLELEIVGTFLVVYTSLNCLWMGLNSLLSIGSHRLSSLFSNEFSLEFLASSNPK